MTTTHRYTATCAWTGSTGLGYDGFERAHEVRTDPASTGLAVSADPAFRGDSAMVNPEQLLVAAAASCQLLSFLAVAARARVDVVAYEDRAEAEMPDDDRPVRITRITLRPTITVDGVVRPDQLQRLVEVAHRECFIANSLRAEIVIEPTFVETPRLRSEVVRG